MSQINPFDKLRVDGEQSRTINLQPLKGFRDFLPKEARNRQWLKDQMIKVFEKWGYEPLETPTLEPLDIFTGQVGEDEKLFYKFKDQGDREVLLRYDQTVPSCRVVGQNYNQITFPFRRYQIQSNFRAEKPQKGRFREFTQADIDIYGTRSPLADAECIALSLDLYKSLGFQKAVALINNRDLLSNIPYSAIASIDKLNKIGEDSVIAEMVQKGIDRNKSLEYFDQIKNLQPDETLKTIFNYLKNYGFNDSWFVFEPTLARSFSYSQGPIWEMKIPGYEVGSVGGGERYDNMVEKITGRKIPATGIAYGFDRTLEACEQFGLIPALKTAAQVLVTIFDEGLTPKSIEVSQKLRERGITVELYPDSSVKLDKQLKYADKRGISFAIIIGPEEAQRSSVTLKNLATKQQKTVLSEELSNLLMIEWQELKI